MYRRVSRRSSSAWPRESCISGDAQLKERGSSHDLRIGRKLGPASQGDQRHSSACRLLLDLGVEGDAAVAKVLIEAPDNEGPKGDGAARREESL